ncbi:extracellular serine-rich protein [Paecilomyces variotii No. 5]|uniref:Extracellular serine-rich protein n=1 Tax=Byssochlamys spectabilis (strain No. 5 / NBRC 109023) TaxID=1356009 RepID=V5G8J4_BYSSN|nr:extracellular serine-rich protein [Paecilomyces variotii No. 5]
MAVSLANLTAVAASYVSVNPVESSSVLSTVLVLAIDSTSAQTATSGLNAYGIPFTTVIVPQEGVTLPDLNGTSGGNFGGIVVASEVSYDYGGTTGWQSALSTDQWNQLYAYQLEYGVRMVQYDVYPGPNYGASAIDDGCCNTGIEQELSLTDISDFPTSGLRTGAGISTEGLWHYPATITNTSTAKEIAQFASNSQYSGTSTAAVINDFDGRQQMAFFISFDTTWSPTSTYLQHAWITWMTRGLYSGYRRVNLNTQVDDMFLESDIYSPNGTTFRIRVSDLEATATWIDEVNTKLNSGSEYFPEICHNGNGNIESAADAPNGDSACNEGGIEYGDIPDTPLEFKKPLGTGTNVWPATPTVYDWTTECTDLDPLKIWWTTPENRDKFAHISHTFTHEEQDNATYSDVYKEISFNIAWLNQTGISSAKRFTPNGIVPPAITGLHNGDALRAWSDNGIKNCVGDNTRPVLLNQQNEMWPYITTFDSDGFDGMQVNPRWATRIYYNCDTPDCTTQEWIDTSAGSGDFYDLLAVEKQDTMRHLFGLYHDPYMFHQANLRQSDAPQITINGVTAKLSLLQAWVETMIQEFVRLADWPILSIKHQDMSDSFAARMARDACQYGLTWAFDNKQITGVTVTANGNTCNSPIPVTFPVAPTSTQGFTTEQVGSDPLTVWVELTGSPVSFTLSTPIRL